MPVPDLVIEVMFFTPAIVRVWPTVPAPFVFALKVRVFPESPPAAALANAVPPAPTLEADRLLQELRLQRRLLGVTLVIAVAALAVALLPLLR